MTDKKILELVDTMIANKIILNGVVYFPAEDVSAVTGALHEMAVEKLGTFKSMAN